MIVLCFNIYFFVCRIDNIFYLNLTKNKKDKLCNNEICSATKICKVEIEN